MKSIKIYNIFLKIYELEFTKKYIFIKKNKINANKANNSKIKYTVVVCLEKLFNDISKELSKLEK